jgi:hypothetical protein
MISVRWTLLFIGYVSLSFIVAGCAGTSSRLPRTLSPSEKNANLEKYFEQTKDIDYIIKALKDEDNMVRMTAARILGESSDRRAVEPLVNALRTDKNYAVREEAAHALRKKKDPRAVDALIDALGDKESGVQRLAAASLGEIGDRRAVEPLLITLREDRSPLVRSAVLAALDEIGWKMPPMTTPTQLESIPAVIDQRQQLPRIWLFAVGISKYRHQNIDLAYASKDALDFYNFMLASGSEHIKRQRAVLLLNIQATRANIIGKFTRFMKRTMPEDLVIVYLATHGLPDPEINELNFVAYDTDLNNLLATGVSQSDIARALTYGRAKKVLIILDSCHSGQLEASIFIAKRGILVTSMNSFLSQLTEARDGVAILSASSAAELSEEGEHYGGGHGAFTYFLLEALRGKADTDGNGIVTLREAYDHTYRNVSETTEGRQHPELKGIFDNELPLIDVK